MDLNQETREYYESVDGIVMDITSAVRSGEIDADEWSDRLHEIVDGNFWVIYTYQAKLVVAFISDNDTAAFDEGMELDHSAGINWSGLAYFAMYADACERMPDFDAMLAERDEIVDSVARMLFVTAFADACEDEELASEGFEIDRTQAAGAGQDWFDTVTDDTPGEAIDRAREIVADFEARNSRTIEDAGNEWSALDFHYGAGREHGLERFGYCIAMTYLGAGVGLWDDFRGDKPPAFECAYTEFNALEFL